VSLERRTPLRRSTPLARGAKPLHRRTRLRVRSAKRAAIAPERAAFVARVLTERSVCEFGRQVSWAIHSPGITLRDAALIVRAVRDCAKRSVDVHEVWTRGRGGPIVPSAGLTDDGVLALCRPCHDWVTTHPDLAEILGCVIHSWEAPR